MVSNFKNFVNQLHIYKIVKGKLITVIYRFKDSGSGRAVISEKLEYLKTTRFLIFSSLFREIELLATENGVAKFMLNFEHSEIGEVKMATFLEITPQTVTLYLRELYIFLS